MTNRSQVYLQESLVTQRSGRYVIPIKADFRGRFPGIVHDTSASGATLFIEPLALVEMGNQWRELQIEEQKEVERILAVLSALVAGLADELAWTVEALAELDLALAKARYAHSLEATEPTVSACRQPHTAASERSRGVGLDLRQARHPLLDPKKVVPIDVHLGSDYGTTALVITGPNTGGKTVTLKTVGLMVAMAQSGLHLPVAEGSSLSVFDGIYADIGDEQSIEQSLSTFSSHLTNIVDILGRAGECSLVLLDELGAGTDPVEGSALARAILSHLLARRITTLVATHYSELKAFAHTTPGVENASVEFDVETLSPTYRLQIGLPGRSNAFAIAQRLGLAAEIVGAARALVSPEELEAEALLAQIQQAHQQAAVARDEAQAAQRRVTEQERRLTARLAEIEGERAAILGEVRAQARRELDDVRHEIEALRSRDGRAPPRIGPWGRVAGPGPSASGAKGKGGAPATPSPLPEEENLLGEIATGDSGVGGRAGHLGRGHRPGRRRGGGPSGQLSRAREKASPGAASAAQVRGRAGDQAAPMRGPSGAGVPCLSRDGAGPARPAGGGDRAPPGQVPGRCLSGWVALCADRPWQGHRCPPPGRAATIAWPSPGPFATPWGTGRGRRWGHCGPPGPGLSRPCNWGPLRGRTTVPRRAGCCL